MKYGKHPVTGSPLKQEDLIPLTFYRNSEGEYHCPVLKKVFTEFTHIVAVKTTGNVYCHEAIKELNLKTKNWKELLTDEPFTKQDLITIQMLHLYVGIEETNLGVEEPESEPYIPYMAEVDFENQPSTSAYVSFTEPESYPQVTEGLSNVYLDRGSGSWDRYITGPSEENLTYWLNTAASWVENVGRGWDPIDPAYDANAHCLDDGDNNHDALRSDTEPEIVYGDFSEEDNIEEDDINDDNIRAFADDEMSSRQPPGSTLPRNRAPFMPDTSEMPSFFDKVFGEELPDFIGVLGFLRSNFYNPDKGELAVNMIFKDKNDLIASVKDYSVRVARREYIVVESTHTLWKLHCRNTQSTVSCRWGLLISFKSKTGYWKLTKYGGPHTYISTNAGIDHRNLSSEMVANTLLGIVM